MTDLTSPEQANQRRDRIEDELITDVESVVEQFLRDVKEQAEEAFRAYALTAAGRRVANPFAYTNVINRWREVVRDSVALRDDLDDVRELFERSDLPDAVFADVAEVLTEEGLTEMGRRRKLTRLLLPEKDEDEGRYRNKIVTIARSAATRRFNQTQLNNLAESGYTEKTWVSRHDDKTRKTHLEADGTTLPLAEAFTVGDSRLMYPGDFTGSTGETVNCRCVIVGANRVEEFDWDSLPEPTSGSLEMSTTAPVERWEKEVEFIGLNENNRPIFAETGNPKPIYKKNPRRGVEESYIEGYTREEVHKELADRLRGGEHIPVKPLSWDEGEYLGRNAQIDALDAAIRRRETSADVRLFRGVADSGIYDGFGVGDIFTDKSYVSTTKSEDIAKEFAIFRAEGESSGLGVSQRERGGTPMVIHMIVPEGTPIAMGDDSVMECILMRDSRFKIRYKTEDTMVVEVMP